LFQLVSNWHYNNEKKKDSLKINPKSFYCKIKYEEDINFFKVSSTEHLPNLKKKTQFYLKQ